MTSTRPSQDVAGAARVPSVGTVPAPAARRTRRALVSIWLCGLALLAGAIALSWNGEPYWMDAEDYARSVATGRWVVHPPGYLFFVAAGRLLYALGFADAHTALQVLTLLCTLGGMLVLYRLLRVAVGPLPSSLLVFTFALSWVPLLIHHTGTSSTSDLLTTPLLLWAAVRLSVRPTRAAAALLALAVVLCGGFRLTTLIMMGPLLLAVLWGNRHHLSVWIACAVGGLVVGLVQLLVIRWSGGWDLYVFMVWKQNFFRTYNVIDFFAWPALLNLGRSLLWLALATLGLPFALLYLGPRRRWSPEQRLLLLYGGLATAGPVAVCMFYLCEHPGYLAPALAGLYLCVAVAWDRADGRRRFAKWPIVSIVASLLLFFGMHYYRAPATPLQAAANGLLLQFSADGARHAHYQTHSEWLRAVDELRRR